jgi:phosphoribosylformylglycinamidine synthase
VVACGINPHLGDFDPFWMAASAIDEAIRNCVAVGADPARIAILDNFCWGNTERPETLGTLVRAALGCRSAAVGYGTPFVSGKDSLNNEFSFEDAAGVRRTTAIPSTLLITALGQTPDVELCVTMDLKRPGSLLFLAGDTRDEFGGSHWNLVREQCEGLVPTVEPHRALQIFRAVHQAIREQLLLSCHDLSEGGLAVSAAEMAFAGDIGAELLLDEAVHGAALELVPQAARPGVLLFSESNSRFLIEVAAESAGRLRELFGNLPLLEIGRTTTRPELHVTCAGQTLIHDSLSNLRDCWQKPLRF